jgi:hypothetical protein
MITQAGPIPNRICVVRVSQGLGTRSVALIIALPLAT